MTTVKAVLTASLCTVSILAAACAADEIYWQNNLISKQDAYIHAVEKAMTLQKKLMDNQIIQIKQLLTIVKSIDPITGAKLENMLVEELVEK